MFDFHCHILPGIDDGSQNLAMSMELVRQSVADGVTHMVTTPHGSSRGLEVQLDRRDAALSMLRERLAEEGIELTLIPGLEYFADSNTTESGSERPRCRCGEQGVGPLLFELPLDMDIAILESILFDAQRRNLNLVLAHPERYRGFTRSVAYFSELQDRGLYLQFNSEDFERSFFRPSPSREMLKLVEHDPEHSLIGSDAHHPTYRPAGLRIGRERIRKALGEEVWMTVSERVPRRLLGL